MIFNKGLRLGRIVFALLLWASAAVASEDLASWFADGKVHGNIRYYYIETNKDDGKGVTSSAHANAVGGKLSYQTASLYGLQLGATFMTTNPFALPDVVDTSIIGKDNGIRGGNPEKGFSVLGEAYANYSGDHFGLWYGRKVISTPLIHAKEVRMLPSAVQGGFANASHASWRLEAGYLDRFKQRTSDDFINIVEHALGTDTEAVTGKTAGYVIPVGLIFDHRTLKVQAYDYYSPDFMNSIYLEADYTHALNLLDLSVAAQYIVQRSVGNADDNLQKGGSITGGQKLNSNAFGLKASAKHMETDVSVAYSNVLRSEDEHDSLVLPWDGTPLFTNMITSNDLFQSLYGNAFKADSAYIGGTAGIRLGVTQGFDFTGFDGVKASVAWAQFGNDRPGFDREQQDFNAVVGYSANAFSLTFKGMWVSNNSAADKTGNVAQLDSLTQYRVIADYKF